MMPGFVQSSENSGVTKNKIPVLKHLTLSLGSDTHTQVMSTEAESGTAQMDRPW